MAVSDASGLAQGNGWSMDTDPSQVLQETEVTQVGVGEDGPTPLDEVDRQELATTRNEDHFGPGASQEEQTSHAELQSLRAILMKHTDDEPLPLPSRGKSRSSTLR